ncbi:MAG TPA: ribonuclease H-like domain-containing protein [Longilinea sp.]|nr:ribonuclease H-like domain-containing protein [Longilinea sp.]
MESLSDRLKALGVQLGTQNLRPHSAQDRFPIEDVIAGEEIETPLGVVFQITQQFDIHYQHGQVHFDAPLNLQLVREWGKTDIEKSNQIDQLIFLDTETTGLAGGAGTFAFLVGLGIWNPDGFRLVQLFMRNPGEEPAMLAVLNRIVAPFKTVVTFNGKTFDIPLLNSRHLINSITTPFSNMAHLDLLPLARRLWRNRLPSRALGDLERDILGVVRSGEEIPGWMVPQIYVDYLRSGDARPMKGVLYHNAMDILSLAALLHYDAHLLENPLKIEPTEGLDLVAIAQIYEEMGDLGKSIELYEAGLNAGLPQPIFIQTLHRYASIYRKRNAWPETIALWQRAAEQQDIPAAIELAKYYEHHERLPMDALRWTDNALGWLLLLPLRPSEKLYWKSELEHRRDRLMRKIRTGALEDGG